MVRTGIANYSLHPLKLKPHEVLQWAHDAGADGVIFSDLPPAMRDSLTMSYLHDLGQMARDLNMYIEWGNGQHIPFNMADWSPSDIIPSNMKAIGEARAIGTRIIRTCSEGMLRANPLNPHTADLMKATIAALRQMMPVLADNDVVLAIETHFEFTSFELLRIFEMCGAKPGGNLGICLDTMNLLTMLEDPVKASERLMPWVVCTHIKDGGLVFDRHGLTAFPADIGSGIVDIGKIVSLISGQERDINLSVECHGGSHLLPVHDQWYINQFPNLTISEYNNLMLLEEKAEELMGAGTLAVRSEDEWATVCGDRTIHNLKMLKEIMDTCI